MTDGSPSPPYVGRFAPSPTGPLHFGSLLAAMASYLDARAHDGRWLLRIEDIDPPRAQRGADREILRTLEACGFQWDGEVHYQSRRIESHRAIVRQLLDRGMAYPCGCSRQDLADCPRGPLGVIYPGYCRAGCDAAETAIRLRTDDRLVDFADRLQGRQSQRLETESGDFVILRRDGRIAYQLAVVADDFDQGITHVVRGVDLLASTPRQVFLQRCLDYPTPSYAHIPVAETPAGEKLGKSTGAPGIARDAVRPALVTALSALGQRPPADLVDADLPALWSWAVSHWSIEHLAGVSAVVVRPRPESLQGVGLGSQAEIGYGSDDPSRARE